MHETEFSGEPELKRSRCECTVFKGYSISYATSSHHLPFVVEVQLPTSKVITTYNLNLRSLTTIEFAGQVDLKKEIYILDDSHYFPNRL